MQHRYSRQTRLKSFGEEAQSKLAEAKVLIVGLGGLGLPVAQYLNAMGVGTLGLVDQDVVELHNLQRQVLYSEKDVGRQKLEVAHEKLRQQNSSTHFDIFDTFLTKDNALELIGQFDVVVDATDNFPTRYLINDACVMLNKPFVYGALHGFEGHVSVFNLNDGPTYRCLYPTMPSEQEIPDCNDNGVLGVVPGIIGSLQALEVVKLVTGVGEVLSGRLLLYDGLSQRANQIKFGAKPEFKKISQLQNAYGPSDCERVSQLSSDNFIAMRNSKQNYTLIDVRTPQEYDQYHLPEAKNIPLDQLEDSNLQWENPKEVYVICQSGKRSATAVKLFQTKYPNLQFHSILGGMNSLEAISHNI
nr:HesA/MoeB/ThiF family protein [Allomuricauda sp.]